MLMEYISPCKKGDIFLVSYPKRICRVFQARKTAEQSPRLASGVVTFVTEEISGCHKRKPMANILQVCLLLPANKAGSMEPLTISGLKFFLPEY